MARFLQEPSGRKWLSEDPIGFEAGDVNLSRYVTNQATMMIDSHGLDQGIGQGIETTGGQGEVYNFQERSVAVQVPDWIQISSHTVDMNRQWRNQEMAIRSKKLLSEIHRHRPDDTDYEYKEAVQSRAFGTARIAGAGAALAFGGWFPVIVAPWIADQLFTGGMEIGEGKQHDSYGAEILKDNFGDGITGVVLGGVYDSAPDIVVGGQQIIRRFGKTPVPKGLTPAQKEINRTFRSLENNRETLRSLEATRKRLQNSRPMNPMDELGFDEHLTKRLEAIDSAAESIRKQIQAEQATIDLLLPGK